MLNYKILNKRYIIMQQACRTLTVINENDNNNSVQTPFWQVICASQTSTVRHRHSSHPHSVTDNTTSALLTSWPSECILGPPRCSPTYTSCPSSCTGRWRKARSGRTADPDCVPPWPRRGTCSWWWGCWHSAGWAGPPCCGSQPGGPCTQTTPACRRRLASPLNAPLAGGRAVE